MCLALKLWISSSFPAYSPSTFFANRLTSITNSTRGGTGCYFLSGRFLDLRFRTFCLLTNKRTLFTQQRWRTVQDVLERVCAARFSVFSSLCTRLGARSSHTFYCLPVTIVCLSLHFSFFASFSHQNFFVMFQNRTCERHFFPVEQF